MILFFTIVGYIFIIVSAAFINYIYDVFSINGLTNFLKPSHGNSLWNDINLTVFPILVWSLIELPAFGNNKLYLLSIILNIFISLAVTYEIKFISKTFFNQEDNIINVISIIVSTFFGQIVSYITLKINITTNNYFISIIGYAIVFILYCLLQTNKHKRK